MNQINLASQVDSYINQAANLMNKGLLKEADEILAPLAKQFPNYTKLLFYFGTLKLNQKQPQKAREIFRHALKIENNPAIISAIAQTYWREEEYEKSLKILEDAAATYPTDVNIFGNIIMGNFSQANFPAIRSYTDKLLSLPNLTEENRQICYAARTVIGYLENDFSELDKALPILENPNLQNAESLSLTHMLKLYVNYIARLREFQQQNPALYSGGAAQKIYFVGDSHSLSAAHLVINGAKILPKLLFGTKAWYLKKASNKLNKTAFRKIISEIPAGSKVILNFGEIDLRPNEGVFPRGGDLEKNTRELVADYVEFTSRICEKNNLQYNYLGIHAPKISNVQKYIPAEKQQQYLAITPIFNDALKQLTGDKYIDIYDKTVGNQGFAKDDVHIDFVHLKPSILVEILQGKYA